MVESLTLLVPAGQEVNTCARVGTRVLTSWPTVVVAPATLIVPAKVTAPLTLSVPVISSVVVGAALPKPRRLFVSSQKKLLLSCASKLLAPTNKIEPTVP